MAPTREPAQVGFTGGEQSTAGLQAQLLNGGEPQELQAAWSYSLSNESLHKAALGESQISQGNANGDEALVDERVTCLDPFLFDIHDVSGSFIPDMFNTLN
uniref:Uncharacterized protein n=1 Tax=Erythrolobus madagascarensis TaxID=708628 RepID=A0A7S0XHZ5_9RHOD